MLWSRGWHETKWRFFYCLVLFAIPLGTEYLRGVRTDAALRALLDNLALLWILFPLILAGAGVDSQRGLRRGLHGSAYFTLGLPVTRFRLLATRVGLGLLEMIGVIAVVMAGIWGMFPLVREAATLGDAGRYFLVLAASTSGFYALSVLFAAAMDTVWRVWFCFGLLVLARWAMGHLDFPAAFDCFRATSYGSPLLTHATPWRAMALSMGIAAILFAAASKIVEEREY